MSATYQAYTNLLPGRFVKEVSAGIVDYCTDGSATCVGVTYPSQNKAPAPWNSTIYAAETGQPVVVLEPGEMCSDFVAGETLADDTIELTSGAAGVAVAATTGDNVYAIKRTEGSVAANERFTGVVQYNAPKHA